MGVFARHPDITEPVLRTIDPDIIIISTNRSHRNDATVWPDGTYDVVWDPESEYNHGDGTPSRPCDRLFHELYHVYEIHNGTHNRHFCGSSELPISEVNATRAQNRLRVALGLPPRTEYGGIPLPEGSCTDPPPPPPPPAFGCGASCAMSWGEPHLKTFDQVSYDFQAVGEFVAAVDGKGDFEVQLRQQAWPGSRTVALNTAVAMRVGRDVVALQIIRQQFVLFINGKRQALKSNTLQDGSLTIQNGNHALVVWNDGSRVAINFFNTYGLDVFIEPAAARKGRLSGILGNFNGVAEDDLVIRGTKQKIEPVFKALYPAFADSWRVKNASTLFSYETGQSAATFTDKSLPEGSVDPAKLPMAKTAAKLCAGKGLSGVFLQGCILDVALTGKHEFAHSAHQVQRSGLLKTIRKETWNVSVNASRTEQSMTFQAKAKDKVFVDVSHSTLPAQCGNLRLLDKDKQLLGEGCVVVGDGLIETTAIPKDGTYTLAIGTLPGTQGQALVQLIWVTDQSEPIEPNGKPVDANINQPGMRAEFVFNGKAGTQYQVEFSRSTLPAQCGGYFVQSPQGEEVGSGCLVQASETFQTAPLPTSGAYKIILDPLGKSTGGATVRLITLP